MKVLVLVVFLLLLILLFAAKKPMVKQGNVSETGPGYIPAFQGHPQVGSLT
jgi:hypothetical protein